MARSYAAFGGRDGCAADLTSALAAVARVAAVEGGAARLGSIFGVYAPPDRPRTARPAVVVSDRSGVTVREYALRAFTSAAAAAAAAFRC